MNHAEHEWAKEQLAAHLAGGLPAEERARLEAHVGACAECIAELDALRRFEGSMEELFEPVRPKPGLEERVIRSLRAAPEVPVFPFLVRATLAAAALALFALVGWIFTEGSYKSPEAAAPAAAPNKPLIPEFDGIPSAGEMAGSRFGKEIGKLNRLPDFADAWKPRAAEERNETPDDGDFQKVKGEGLEFSSDRPFGSSSSSKKLGGAERRENYYSFRNAAPVERPLDPSYFQPARAPAAAPEKEKLAEAMERLTDLAEKQTGLFKETAAPQEPERKIIRTGEMEFEIDSFDSTLTTIRKIAGEEKGFVGTVNSEKLPNGKVRGTVVLRVPPENLDNLILKLRALGDLKSQRIASQDVTKHYTDLESRLRAARTMEERLLKIIKDGKGEIKDLLQAEKELGEWRTRIESLEGEIRYYANQISLSTLTLTLFEREIRTPFGVTETRRFQMGIEVEDVEKAHRDAETAVAEAKGRVTKSELKKYDGGQLNAILHFEVAPEAAGPLQDRLRQLGTVARLEVDTDQQTEGGSGRAAEVKVKKNETQFFVSLYNVANVAPRETVMISLAAVDAEAAYKAILARVEKAGGRVVTSTLNRQKSEQTTGSIHFEVKAAEAAAVQEDVRKEGEVMRLQGVENPDAQNVTRSKRGFRIQLHAMGLVAPRETATVQLACRDVPAAYGALLEALGKVQARVLSSNLNEQDRQNVTGHLDFEVRREHEKAVAAAMSAAGTVYTRTSARAQDVENVVDSKVRLQLTLINVARIPPREHFVLGIEVGDVERAMAAVAAEGRAIESRVARRPDGRVVGKVIVEVPLAQGAALARKVREMGTVRVVESWRDPKVADSELAVARLEVTISNAELIVETGEGPWDQIKSGLSASLKALLFSLRLVVIGLCFVLPVALFLWGGWKVYRKRAAKPSPAS